MAMGWWLCLRTLAAVSIALASVLFLWLLQAYRRLQKGKAQRRNERPEETLVGIFHPYCNAGGGGERVLWCTVRALQQQHPHVRCLIYTGDQGVTGKDILSKAKKSFNVTPIRPVDFVFLKKRHWVEAEKYPLFTLLGQSLGSLLLAWEALNVSVPDVYLDTMGYAFSYPLFRLLGGCRVACYVHYPTVSTDMIQTVSTQQPAFNHHPIISNSVVLSYAKLLYYRAFTCLYRLVGSFAEVVMTNSTWTYNHMCVVWGRKERIVRVYPPCHTEGLQQLALTSHRQHNRVLSVAQFRPEKNHSLQLAALRLFLDRYPEHKSTTRLYLVGGCRDTGDEERVRALKKEAQEMGLGENISIKTNVTYVELLDHLESAVIGLHTMANEHFGIGVVEFMAAGVIAVAHNSAGPKEDIVLDNYNGSPTGFRAITADEYADCLKKILVDMTPDERLRVQQAARDSVVERFSEKGFEEGLLAAMAPLLSK